MDIKTDNLDFSAIIKVFEAELTNWSYEAFMQAGAKDKESIAEEAITQFPNLARQEIYDIFWEWVDTLTEADFSTKNESLDKSEDWVARLNAHDEKEKQLSKTEDELIKRNLKANAKLSGEDAWLDRLHNFDTRQSTLLDLENEDI